MVPWKAVVLSSVWYLCLAPDLSRWIARLLYRWGICISLSLHTRIWSPMDIICWPVVTRCRSLTSWASSWGSIGMSLPMRDMGLKTVSQAVKTCPASIYAAGAKLWRLVSAAWDDLCDPEHLWRETQIHIGSVGYSLKKKIPIFIFTIKSLCYKNSIFPKSVY